MRALLSGGLVIVLGFVFYMALWSADEEAPPAPVARVGEKSAPALPGTRPIASGSSAAEDFIRPAPPKTPEPERRALQEQMARDPARIEAAERALGRFESLFLDSAALESVEPGDIRGGMLPQPLSHRKIALAAIDTVISHPENSGEIRAHSLRVLESLVQQPWPAVATAEADQFVLQERGHALATLVKADPDVASAAYRGIPESVARDRIARRAVHLLAKGGMAKEEARARVDRLATP